MTKRLVAQRVAREVRRALSALNVHLYDQTFSGLKQAIEAYYGKPITIKPVLNGHDLTRTTGLWLDYDNEGVVLYRPDDHQIYRGFTVFHEFGHIAARHRSCGFGIDFDAVGLDLRKEHVRAIREHSPQVLTVGDISAEDLEELVAEELGYQFQKWVLGALRNRDEMAFG